MDHKHFFSNLSSGNSLFVIDKTLKNYVPISLADENEALKGFDTSLSIDWESYIQIYLTKHNGDVAYGGYMEKRNLYKRSTHFNAGLERNIHLGIDFWCDAGTKVLAVLGGEIHSFQNNSAYGDYGPTIIIKHNYDDREFYSLYGHLSLHSLENLEAGRKVNQGEVIARLGNAQENGDYAPHLHFQLIMNLQGNEGDYPGVCNEKDVDYYKMNCPDPNLLLELN